MKRILSAILFLILAFCPAFASTEASKFAENQYKEQNKVNEVHITVKKEHTEEYIQKIGETQIPAITYGYGDMKIKGCKKCRISYICLLDKDCKPFWSFIVPSK